LEEKEEEENGVGERVDEGVGEGGGGEGG